MSLSPVEESAGRPRNRELVFALLAGGFSCTVLLLFLLFPRIAPGLKVDGSAVIGIAATTVGALFAAIMRPKWVFYGFLLLCMTFPFELEQISFSAGFFKLYVQDIVFLFNMALIAWRFSIGKQGLWRNSFNKYILIHIGVGVLALINGFFVQGNAFDYSFGDFRRAFFYFLNYFVVLFLTDNLGDLRRLIMVLNAGGLALIVKGIGQMALGQYYYRRIGDAAHILSHFELTFLSFTVLYALVRMAFSSRNRLFWSCVFAAGLIVTLIGNYRAAWLSMIAGTIFIFLYLNVRKKLFIVFSGLLALFFLILTVSVLWDVQIEGQTTIGEEIAMKADVKNAASDPNVIWRFQSYENALNLWRTSPIIGVGLGEELEFSASTSTGGAMLATGHRVHNSLLWMLMSLGVAGFAVFLFVQLKYAARVLRYIRNAEWDEGRIIVMTCGAFYVSFMVSTMFEIFLESALPVTLLSVSIAIAALVMHLSPQIAGEDRKLL